MDQDESAMDASLAFHPASSSTFVERKEIYQEKIQSSVIFLWKTSVRELGEFLIPLQALW